MTFWKLFKVKACSIQLAANEKEPVLREIVAMMITGGVLPSSLQERGVDALTTREALASTGVGGGIAVPHVQLPGLEQVAMNLCVHPRGVEWGAVDGQPVQVFFTVLRPTKHGPLHDPERHLEMMRWIARLARSADFRRFAANTTSRGELIELLKEMQNA
jgi:mannitol/fructose-specific phosphotransferase system IIA component (Ntr-type)